MITIYEIAKLAKCSPSTVSKALNNSREISEQKKEAILAIAKDNNYIINQSARSLSTKQNKLLGIIYVEDSGLGLTHHFYSRLIEHFRRHAEQYEYDIIFIHNHNHYGNTKMSYYEHCKYRQVSGVFVPTFDGHFEDQIDHLLQSEIPLVAADSSKRAISTVVSDDVQGSELATEYLLGLGHRTICHIAGPTKGEHASISAIDRAKGFCKVAKRNKEKAELTIYATEDYSYQSGYKAMKKVLATFPQYAHTHNQYHTPAHNKPPSAIFAASDILALGAINAILEKGLTVPKDISIIGYDDIEMLRYFTPQLTTMRQRKDLLGQKAAEMLIASIEQNIPPQAIAPIPVELVERESCGIASHSPHTEPLQAVQ